MEFTTRIGFGSGRMELLPRLTIPGRFLSELLQCVLARRTVSIAMVECLSWMSVCSRERALNSEVGSDIHSLIAVFNDGDGNSYYETKPLWTDSVVLYLSLGLLLVDGRVLRLVGRRFVSVRNLTSLARHSK